MNRKNSFRVDSQINQKKKWSVFLLLDTFFKKTSIFYDGIPIVHLPKVLFVVLLGLLYIYNSHYTEKVTRKIDKIEVVVEDLRANYTTLKSNYMYASKQSEVAKKVKLIGLQESLSPPDKIVIRKGEY